MRCDKCSSQVLSFSVGMVLAVLFFHGWGRISRYSASSNVEITIPMSKFEGEMWKTNNTLAVVTLASCKYGQFQSHTVKTDSGKVAKNWLWTNDRDQVNILVSWTFLFTLHYHINYLWFFV